MNKKIIVPALLAIAMASGATAFAQDQYRSDRDGGWQQQRDSAYRQDQRMRDEREQRDYQRDSRWQERQDEHDRRWRERERHHRSEGNWGRTESFSAGYDGAGPYHDLRRGEPLPGRYRTHQYVVDNWRAFHLPRPRHGYRWVQAGADYVLVDASTGIIAQVAYGH